MTQPVQTEFISSSANNVYQTSEQTQAQAEQAVRCPFSGSLANLDPAADDIPAIHLLSPEQVDSGQVDSAVSSGELVALQATLHWTRGFIMQPHPDLGRPGAVCPFVKPAMQDNLLFLSICRLPDPADAESVYRQLLPFGHYFLHLASRLGEQGRLLTILVVMPDMSEAIAMDIMEPLHKRLKTRFLDDGLLVGQFYPDCTVPATWNESFYPLQSPYPMFVFRNLIETDWRFLVGNPDWEAVFNQYFLPA